jgi:hypothetical protein
MPRVHLRSQSSLIRKGKQPSARPILNLQLKGLDEVERSTVNNLVNQEICRLSELILDGPDGSGSRQVISSCPFDEMTDPSKSKVLHTMLTSETSKILQEPSLNKQITKWANASRTVQSESVVFHNMLHDSLTSSSSNLALQFSKLLSCSDQKVPCEFSDFRPELIIALCKVTSPSVKGHLEDLSALTELRDFGGLNTGVTSPINLTNAWPLRKHKAVNDPTFFSDRNSFKNYSSAEKLSALVITQLETHVSKGEAVELDPTLLNSVTNHKLAVVLKKSGAIRLITDCTESNLNRLINQNLFESISLPDLPKILSRFRQNIFVLEEDAKSAFNQIPIREDDSQFFACYIGGRLFAFRCLVFGASSSPLLYCKTTAPINRLIQRLAKVKSSVYIDDRTTPTSENLKQAIISMITCLLICYICGLRIEFKKLHLSRTPVILGFSVDTAHKTIAVEQDKAKMIRDDLESIISQKSSTLKDLQRLTGRLVWLSRITPGLRSNLEPFFSTTKGIEKSVKRRYPFQNRLQPSFKIPLRLKLAARLFLSSLNNLKVPWSTLLPQVLLSKPPTTLTILSDASSDIGCGALLFIESSTIESKTYYFALRWSAPTKNVISALELATLCLATEVGLSTFQDGIIPTLVLLSDNTATTSTMSRLRGKSPSTNSIISTFVSRTPAALSEKLVVHIPGKSNTTADFLSRFPASEILKTSTNHGWTKMSVPPDAINDYFRGCCPSVITQL